MKLSVLITTYNIEKYINKTLESVFNQKVNFDYEVIVGDDGSTDRTLEFIELWKRKTSKKFSIYVMQRKQNVKYDPIIRASKNRLSILKYAKGEYVTFLDGDDFYTDDSKFQRQVDILEKNRECALCLHNFCNYYEEEDREEVASQIKYNGVLNSKKYWKEYYVPAETGIYRNIFSDDWFKEWGEKPFDDNLIVFNQLKYGKIYFIQNSMVDYRQNPTSWKQNSKLEKAFLNYIDYDLEKQINPDLKRYSLSRHYCNLLEMWKNKKSLGKDLDVRCKDYAKSVKGHTALMYLNWNSLKLKGKVFLAVNFVSDSIIYYYDIYSKAIIYKFKNIKSVGFKKKK